MISPAINDDVAAALRWRVTNLVERWREEAMEKKQILHILDLFLRLFLICLFDFIL